MSSQNVANQLANASKKEIGLDVTLWEDFDEKSESILQDIETQIQDEIPKILRWTDIYGEIDTWESLNDELAIYLNPIYVQLSILDTILQNNELKEISKFLGYEYYKIIENGLFIEHFWFNDTTLDFNSIVQWGL